MRSISFGSVMKALIFSSEPHLGQRRGSISNALRMQRAQEDDERECGSGIGRIGWCCWLDSGVVVTSAFSALAAPLLRQL